MILHNIGLCKLYSNYQFLLVSSGIIIFPTIHGVVYYVYPFPNEKRLDFAFYPTVKDNILALRISNYCSHYLVHCARFSFKTTTIIIIIILYLRGKTAASTWRGGWQCTRRSGDKIEANTNEKQMFLVFFLYTVREGRTYRTYRRRRQIR